MNNMNVIEVINDAYRNGTEEIKEMVEQMAVGIFTYKELIVENKLESGVISENAFQSVSFSAVKIADSVKGICEAQEE